LLFNFASVYAVRKVQENQVEVKFNGTHELPVYANYVKLLGKNIRGLFVKKPPFILGN
jgi:hypothetical protein